MATYVIKVVRSAGIAALFIIAAMLGILSGVLFAYAGDLPQVSVLDDYSPSTITRVLASNGQVVGEFATQRRVIVGYDDVNPLLPFLDRVVYAAAGCVSMPTCWNPTGRSVQDGRRRSMPTCAARASSGRPDPIARRRGEARKIPAFPCHFVPLRLERRHVRGPRTPGGLPRRRNGPHCGL